MRAQSAFCHSMHASFHASENALPSNPKQSASNGAFLRFTAACTSPSRTIWRTSIRIRSGIVDRIVDCLEIACTSRAALRMHRNQDARMKDKRTRTRIVAICETCLCIRDTTSGRSRFSADVTMFRNNIERSLMIVASLVSHIFCLVPRHINCSWRIIAPIRAKIARSVLRNNRRVPFHATNLVSADRESARFPVRRKITSRNLKKASVCQIDKYKTTSTSLSNQLLNLTHALSRR